MNTNRIPGAFLLLFSLLFGSCAKEKATYTQILTADATVTGNSLDGYYCYLDEGGFVLSHDTRLEGIERAHFAFVYESTAPGEPDPATAYLEDPEVHIYWVRRVIQPVTRQQAGELPEPPAGSYYFGFWEKTPGYFDAETMLPFESTTEKPGPVRLEFIYDPAAQTDDTLRLSFYNCPALPRGYHDSDYEFRGAYVSCDLTSLAGLRRWSDTVTVIVGGLGLKITKEDFHKPFNPSSPVPPSRPTTPRPLPGPFHHP